MVNVNITEEEWYPVYEITDKVFSGDTTIELTQFELFKVRRTFQEFEHIQRLLANKVREAKHFNQVENDLT